MSDLNIKEHWETIYGTKNENEVSWFQSYPKTSMEFVELFNLPKDAVIIDIGGGDSHFVDTLLEQGFNDITILDISAKALDRAKKRLGEKAGLIKWIVSNVTEFVPYREYDFWHDRAAFHFLTTPLLTEKYAQIALNGIKKNGHLVLGTFSQTGPDKCSGLVIQKYSQQTLSDKFEVGFKRIKCIEEIHQTPFNTKQDFLFCSFLKI